MESFTITPLALFICGFSLLALIFVGVAVKTGRDIFFGIALIFCISAITSSLVRYNLQCKEAQSAATANNVKDEGIRYAAVKKFVKSGPPPLTPDHYNALIGSKLWISSRTQANWSLRAQCVRDLIILDFATAETE